MISTEFLVSLIIGGAALLLAVYGRRKQNGNPSEVAQLKATADFLLAQNQTLQNTINALHDEMDSLKHELQQTRLELGDARALLRNVQPRT